MVIKSKQPVERGIGQFYPSLLIEYNDAKWTVLDQ